MLTRSTKVRLLAFAVITVVSVAYFLVRFTDVDRLFGAHGYTVTLRLSDTGGIFERAEVTYRGVQVGTVGELALAGDGLIAQLRIRPDTPPIPADVTVRIAQRTAVGQQYVDLQPQSQAGPYLHGGATIPASRVSVPITTGELVSGLNRLVTSVPTDSLRTVVDESFQAFRGTGHDLGVLLDAAREFTTAAQENLPETVQLLDSGATVLRTQNDVAGSLSSFSSDLRKLTETLKTSDADLHELIEVTPEVSQTLDNLIRNTGPGLSSLLANLLTTATIVGTRLDGIEQGLVTYPLLAIAETVAPGGGSVHLGLTLNTFIPPPCVKGYPYARGYVDSDPATPGYRTGTDTADRPPSSEAYCAEPQGSPINVRGAQNAPLHGVPVAPSQQKVQQHSDRDEQSLAHMRHVPGAAGGPGLEITSLSGLLGLGS